MNAFQILSPDNEPIPINVLDREVCVTLGIEVDNKQYCRLGKREDYPKGIKGEWNYLSNCPNWYDTIGWMIADGKSLQGIIDYYTDIMKEYIGQKNEDGTIITIESIYPYHIKLLESWISKGYVAKQITGANRLNLETL